MTPGPKWRWLLMSWCILPEWVASPEEIAACAEPHGETPW